MQDKTPSEEAAYTQQTKIKAIVNNFILFRLNRNLNSN